MARWTNTQDATNALRTRQQSNVGGSNTTPSQPEVQKEEIQPQEIHVNPIVAVGISSRLKKVKYLSEDKQSEGMVEAGNKDLVRKLFGWFHNLSNKIGYPKTPNEFLI
ncbi:hypothetical protein PanWU01x14_367560 [Parasponia andersonii]|uniref:Uncharacterized protein n=1 Tax=Parasponia andersonii TaxID=3476 RepID=A0A2P5A5C0_PARAD|nr:hypothetical protein PanWU01x14_367560 [Parasponia andersonii]